MTTKAQRHSMAKMSVALAAVIGCGMTAMPATAAETATRCAKGTYAGPVVGKTSYRKDTFVWAVSPRFAAEYCMPDAFVDDALPEGIEAVAYRKAEDFDTQVCTRVTDVESCVPQTDHVFELYVRHNAIEHARDGKFYDAINTPSANLINEKLAASQARRAGGQIPAAAVGVRIFDPQQFEMVTAVRGNTDVRFGGLFVRTFYEGILDGLDYVALRGQLGFTRQTIWKQRGAGQPLYILIDHVKRPDDQSPTRAQAVAARDLASYAFALKLPKRIEAALIAADQQ